MLTVEGWSSSLVASLFCGELIRPLFSFGVCCVFFVSSSGSTITQNNTYLRNPGYPNVLTGTDSIQYKVQKCSPSKCTCVK